MSRSSPPTTTPSGRSIRATWRSSGDPFELATRAAAICDAPIFSPTSPPLPWVGAFCFFGALGSFSPLTRLAFGALTACSPAASLLLPNESSRFQNGGCFSFGCLRLRLLAATARRRPCPCSCRTRPRASRTAAAAPSVPWLLRLLLGLDLLLLGRLGALGSLADSASFGPRLTESSFFQKGVLASVESAELDSAARRQARAPARRRPGRRRPAGRARSVPRQEPPRRARPAPAAPRRSACSRAPRSDRSSRSASRSRRSLPGAARPTAGRPPASAAGSAATGSTGAATCASSAAVSSSFLRNENSFFQIEPDTVSSR